MCYVQNYSKRVNMYVVFDKKRLVSKILVWFELVVSYVINGFLRCYNPLLCFNHNYKLFFESFVLNCRIVSNAILLEHVKTRRFGKNDSPRPVLLLFTK